MRESVKVVKTLKAPPGSVWRLISDGDRVERWFEWVAETALNDAREGGSRVIRMKDGSHFDEYITLNDARTLTYQYYAPDPPLPIKHVIGTKRIETSADGGAVLSWFVTFDLTPSAPHDMLKTLRELYEGAMEKIEQHAREVDTSRPGAR
jgi:uncharacterized protein YndB with AHSA1/START domain